jgi:hypothetical protein
VGGRERRLDRCDEKNKTNGPSWGHVTIVKERKATHAWPKNEGEEKKVVYRRPPSDANKKMSELAI